jgi:hypothetical protein
MLILELVLAKNEKKHKTFEFHAKVSIYKLCGLLQISSIQGGFSSLYRLV